jgi:hypothetical protein
MTDCTRHTQSCELENAGAAAMHVGVSITRLTELGRVATIAAS